MPFALARFRARSLVVACLPGLCVLAAFLSLFAGPAPVSFANVVSFLLLNESTDPGRIILNLRLARACLALLCGGCLGVAGVVMQGTLRNPLADPFILGVAQGAACGASLAIAVFGASVARLGFSQAVAISAFSFAGALLALLLALVLGKSRGPFQRENIILAGVAVAAFMSALVALIKALNEDSVASVVFWLLGSLQDKGWTQLPLVLTAAAPCLLVVALNWRKLDVLSLGDERARSLGLRPRLDRDLLLCAASCATAGCVAVCGIIGFIGLIAPHIARMLLGAGHGALLFASFFGGGFLLLVADCAARVVLDNGQELPVGVVASILGAPFFAWLVWRRK